MRCRVSKKGGRRLIVVLLTDDTKAELAALRLKSSDFTSIRNGAADWLSLTVDARQRLIEAVVNAYRLSNTAVQPVAERSVVVPFHQAGPGNWSPDE